MNWDFIKGNWKEFRGKLRHQWGDLTDDDFDRAAGSKDELVGVIQQRYGQTKEEVEQQLDKLAEKS